ncbi:MAG: GTPase ObgE [Oscillospiraceae bacterium]|nr:GTPase ObgE [Oscillospiraceae bacterium]
MFVDKAKIRVKAGDGGDGAVSFYREKYVAAGGPDGGNGGKGGDIIFVIDDNFSTLIDFKYKKKYAAQRGENGGAKHCTGKNGEDLIIKVPRGTLVRDANTGRIIADLSKKDRQIIAKGGNGGKGNSVFKSPTRQIPRFAKPGYPGEEFELSLELKLLADVGLVGFPNVGKSTLISVVSQAKPKIANYHFTTLVPVLGVVKVEAEKSFVMADIPGLIEGASDGIGLGHEFLRHVERCRLILHVLDVSGSEGRDPREDFDIINRELEKFSPDLAECPQIVAANKSDMASPEQIQELKEYIEEKGYTFFEISAATTQGTSELIKYISQELDKLPPIREYEPEEIPEEEIMQKEDERKRITVRKEEDVYYVEAQWLEPILRTVNLDDYSSLQYLQRVLQTNGVFQRLEDMGIEEGETVDIHGFEFEYVK